MVRTWVSDVHVVIERLTALDAHDPNGLLTGRMDLTHIGYVGASFGGSVVVHALLKEPRISAGVAQDGKPYFFDETLSGLERPLMYMQSATPYIPSSDAQLAQWGLTAATFKAAEQDHFARLMQLFARTNGPIYNVYIRGTNHVSFSDLYRIIALPDSGLMDVRRAHRIINEYTVAFFNRYLVGTSERLVDGRTPSPYDEVVVSSRNVVDQDVTD
jgi:predicted dienelactone hydrolase